MAILEITPQFRDEDKHTSQSLTLDQVRFQIVTYTNKADGSWYLDIRDGNGVPIVIGIAMVVGLDLLFPYRYKAVPAGILFLQDTAGPREDPSLTSFSEKTVGLYYQEALT